VKVGEIHREIDLTIDSDAVCGVVSAGRLTVLRSGKADLKAASATRQIDLGIEVGIGSGPGPRRATDDEEELRG
jgi:hypothetical protein